MKFLDKDTRFLFKPIKKIKVLHVGNTAGIGGLLARYMDIYFDYDSLCLYRKQLDKFSLSNEKTRVYNSRASVFLMKAVRLARDYDIIHIHSLDQFLPLFYYPYRNKKFVLHYHGTRIRGRWKKREKYWSKADKILVATPDLLEGSPDNTYFLPNVVNERLCYHLKQNSNARNKRAFHVSRFAPDIAIIFADSYGLEIDIFDRDKTPLKHLEFLKKMSQYSYYIDVKRDFKKKDLTGKVLEAMSLTGYEALALGLKVIDWKGHLITEFPGSHISKVVCNHLNTIYEGLIK